MGERLKVRAKRALVYCGANGYLPRKFVTWIVSNWLKEV